MSHLCHSEATDSGFAVESKFISLRCIPDGNQPLRRCNAQSPFRSTRTRLGELRRDREEFRNRAGSHHQNHAERRSAAIVPAAREVSAITTLHQVSAQVGQKFGRGFAGGRGL